MVSQDTITEVFSNKFGKSIKIHIPASASFSSSVRDIIGTLIKNETQYSARWKHRLQLMVDELVNNAIEHGSSGDNPVKIFITFYNNDDVEIIVEDTGTGDKKVNAEELLVKAKINRELMIQNPGSNKTIRGRGLALIVLNWSDDFSYKNNSNGGVTARLFKKFSLDCA